MATEKPAFRIDAMPLLRRRPRKLLVAFHALCGMLAICGSARADVPADGRTFPAELAGLRAAAFVHSLNAQLLRNTSATLTLDQWCADHHLAPEGSKIVAERVRGEDKPADGAVRRLLRVGPQEPVAYRRVRLRCGERVLSEADNWYVPALLTPEMNRTLDTTDTSFGRVVAPLGFRRETLSAELPAGTLASPGSATRSRYVLQHQAVLLLPDGRPFSALIESYTPEVLAFP